MDLKLDGKRALVTGSTVGIGYAIVEALAKERASVIVNGRTQQRVDQAISRLRDSGAHSNVLGLVADLGSAAVAQTVIELFPEVDIHHWWHIRLWNYFRHLSNQQDAYSCLKIVTLLLVTKPYSI
ncbi:MAG: SDR family NAD(P)-dependent oxidoreductase [Candidatus Acidiferrales bacterium]